MNFTRRFLLFFSALAVSLWGIGCGKSGETNPISSDRNEAAKLTISSDKAGGACELCGPRRPIYAPDIDPDDFSASTRIDHPYFPLTPGTVWIYAGETEDGEERIEMEVLSDIRSVMGIDCVVAHDRVWEDGQLVEDTFDWYAQDDDGNVWYMGEDSSEIEDGQVVNKHGSWEAGIDGALPGIIMQAQPRTGVDYYQEFYRGEAEDQAKVVARDETITIDLDTYDDVLRIEEWTRLEPGIAEHKSYAPGIGVILEEKVAGGEGRIELVEFRPAE